MSTVPHKLAVRILARFFLSPTTDLRMAMGQVGPILPGLQSTNRALLLSRQIFAVGDFLHG
jgi:hypothetical protein